MKLTKLPGLMVLLSKEVNTLRLAAAEGQCTCVVEGVVWAHLSLIAMIIITAEDVGVVVLACMGRTNTRTAVAVADRSMDKEDPEAVDSAVDITNMMIVKVLLGVDFVVEEVMTTARAIPKELMVMTKKSN